MQIISPSLTHQAQLDPDHIDVAFVPIRPSAGWYPYQE